MIYQAIVAALIASTASAKFFPADPEQQKYMWNEWKQSHNKQYKTADEDTRRFGYFLNRLKLVDSRNEAELKAGGNAVHGITKFMDLSPEEFKARLNLDLSKKPKDTPIAEVKEAVNLSSGLVDWTGKFTTPVKDQGYCGSCWAFSATEQIESATMRMSQTTYILSPEQICQCTTSCYGCDGGWPSEGYKYIQSVTGQVQDSDYPYTSYNGVTGTCMVDVSKAVVGVDGWWATKHGDENQMTSYVQSTGPMSIVVDASTWDTYTGGIMTVCPQSVDHAVQATGVLAGTGGYWKVRNSWNTDWGESGYIRLAWGANTCDLTYFSTYVSTYIV